MFNALRNVLIFGMANIQLALQCVAKTGDKMKTVDIPFFNGMCLGL